MNQLYVFNRKQFQVLQVNSNYVVHFDNSYAVIPDDSLESVINIYKRIAKVSFSKDHLEIIKSSNPITTSDDKCIFNISVGML